jgi:hypothetical protein
MDARPGEQRAAARLLIVQGDLRARRLSAIFDQIAPQQKSLFNDFVGAH